MKTFLFILIPIFMLSEAAIAQTVDEILAEHFNVIGQKNLLKSNTFTTKGKIIQGGLEIPFTSYHKRPMFFRSEAVFQGMQIISAFDGSSGWSINPFTGATDPQPMTQEQLDRMTIQADFDGMLYNYKEKGHKVELTGNEMIDGIDSYVIKLTRTNGDIITIYLDAENYVILKQNSKIKFQGVDVETDSYFSNYKLNNGILNPYSIETKQNDQTVMQMLFDEFTYGVEIADSLFIMPEVTAPKDTTVTEEKPE